MPKEFHQRLRNYYEKVAQVLRGEADAASIFANTSDIGASRELVYSRFLQQHAPSKCNVFLGGFLFHADGRESNQLDVIIATDTAPRFNFHNPNGDGKSFSPVEGTVGVVSSKSTLDKKQLFDALTGLASIPPTEPLANRVPATISVKRYDDWPIRVVYAPDGIAPSTLLDHLNAFYAENTHIPITRRPHVIHVAGKQVIFKVSDRITFHDQAGTSVQQSEGTFVSITENCDLQAIVMVLNLLQQNALASTHILFTYNNLINNVINLDS